MTMFSFPHHAYWSDLFWSDSYLNFLGFIPRSKFGLLMVEHNVNPCLKQYGEEIYLKQKRLFTISGFGNTPMLSNIFFGNIKIAKKNDLTTFISIARGRHVRNHDILFDSVKKMIDKKIKNFKVVIVGKYFDDRWVEDNAGSKAAEYIETKGELSFADLYDSIERADFFYLY
ncbi:MAG: hypothetical protein LBS29_05550 [Endomicrobium sp.]|jgi:hypothetical protein|nr:hypothetical protein [Endomicrobium sp.]